MKSIIRLPLRILYNGRLTILAAVRRLGLKGFIVRVPYFLANWRASLGRLSADTPGDNGELFSGISPVPCGSRLHPDLLGVNGTIPVSVTVIIPTLNAGHEFAWLLRKLRAQKGLDRLDIVIVDSGSSDQTVLFATHAGCKVIAIPPTSFSHSYARNLGAKAAESDYLLFMVQDAYPIGEYWIYGMLRFLLDHADKSLVAVSCAEYSRSDSDMMYDSNIDTHYRFLGCHGQDRIGEHGGDDHMSLRICGQLSDVACLIGREIFERYSYRGDYAEDLDLGIRLIKDNHRVAMLSSIKVIHSHNRSAYYYLKRSFVDVVFLVRMFDDFVRPPTLSADGLLLGIVATAAHLSDWLTQEGDRANKGSIHEDLSNWIKQWRKEFVRPRFDESRLGDSKLDAYINGLISRTCLSKDLPLDRKDLDQARLFVESFLARLEHFDKFVEKIYGRQDALLRNELLDALRKSFASAVGSALAFMALEYANTQGREQTMAADFYAELKEGI